jgi:hypothetical protein
MVGAAVTQQESETYTCAICYKTIPQSSPDLLKVNVSRPSTAPFQELFVHRACLKNVIHPKIPLGEVFDEDVL